MSSNAKSLNSFSQAYRDPTEALDEQVVRGCVQGILDAAATHLRMPASKMTVLDCGSGMGDYLFEMEKHVAHATGVEPDSAAYKQAVNRHKAISSRTSLIHGFVEDVKFDQKFDLAVSLTTVEHMPQARKSMESLLEALRPGGIIYLTAPNKLWPFECHYHLPFLSYLPLPLANMYLWLTGNGSSYEDCSYSRTYWGMKKLFAGLSCKVMFVVPDETNKYVGAGDTNVFRSFVRTFGIRLIRRIPAFWIISKGFVMVIQKTH